MRVLCHAFLLQIKVITFVEIYEVVSALRTIVVASDAVCFEEKLSRCGDVS